MTNAIRPKWRGNEMGVTRRQIDYFWRTTIECIGDGPCACATGEFHLRRQSIHGQISEMARENEVLFRLIDKI
jgi:hypothetical protein